MVELEYTIKFKPAKWKEGDPLGQRGTLHITKFWQEGVGYVYNMTTKARNLRELSVDLEKMLEVKELGCVRWPIDFLGDNEELPITTDKNFLAAELQSVRELLEEARRVEDRLGERQFSTRADELRKELGL